MSKDKANKSSSAKKEVAQIFQGKTPSDPHGETSMFDFITLSYMNPVFNFLSEDPTNQLCIEQLGDLNEG